MSKRSQADAFKLQQQAKQLLREGCSTSVIAARLGVSPRTVQRWIGQAPLEPLEKLRHGGNFEVIEGGRDDLEHDYTAQSPVTPNMTTQQGMSVIGSMVMQQLAAVLADPDLTTTNRLKAIALGGEWAGFSRGLAMNVNVAIAFLSSVGYKVVDPTIIDTESKQTRGLTDEVVAEIKSKLLGFTDADYLSEEDDPGYVEPEASLNEPSAPPIKPDAIVPPPQSESLASESVAFDVKALLAKIIK